MMAPPVVMRPILLVAVSVNHRLPSGPAVMPTGPLLAVGVGNSVILPLVVMRPIRFVAFSVNHRLPSGPAVMPAGKLFFVLMWMCLPPLCVVVRCATHNSHASVSHCLLRQRTRRLHDQGEK